MDGSNSISFFDESNWDKLLYFVSSLALTFPLEKGTHVSLIQFGNEAVVEFNLNRYFTASAILDHIGAMQQLRTDTNIAKALNVMRLDVFGGPGDRPDIKDIAIVITDGKHNADGWEVGPEAKYAKEAGIEIFSVGVRSLPPPDSFDLAELQLIASDPDSKHVFTAENFDELVNVIAQLQGPVCDAAGFKPTTPPPPVTPPPPTLPPISRFINITH